MKIFYYLGGGLLALLITVFALQMIASERVEVVELHTLDTTGEMVVTRLWVVDYEGNPYLRAGEESGWYIRLKENSSIKLTRKGQTLNYDAQSVISLRPNINKLMQEKYTWGDTYIGMLFGRDDIIPVKLISI